MFFFCFGLGFGDLVICANSKTPKANQRQFTKKDVKFQEFGDSEIRCLGGSPQEKSRREGGARKVMERDRGHDQFWWVSYLLCQRNMPKKVPVLSGFPSNYGNYRVVKCLFSAKNISEEDLSFKCLGQRSMGFGESTSPKQ